MAKLSVGMAWAQFKQRISSARRFPQANEIWQRFYQQHINYEIIEQIMGYVDAEDPSDFLELDEHEGIFYPRTESSCAMAFFVGRNEEGEFQLVITPNSKTADARSKRENALVIRSTTKVSKLGFRVDSTIPEEKFRGSITNAPEDELDTEAATEISFIAGVNSPFICKAMRSQVFLNHRVGATTNTRHKVILIAPYANKGKLWDLLYEKPKVAPLDEFMFITSILYGLRHIHQFGKRHLDIKPENLVVTNNNWVQYVDFGCSSPPNYKNGTLICWPPEAVAYDSVRYHPLREDMSGSPAHAIWGRNKTAYTDVAETDIFSEKMDVWCAGLCIYQVIMAKVFEVTDWDNLQTQTNLQFLTNMLAAMPQFRASAGESWHAFLREYLQFFPGNVVRQGIDKLFEFVTDPLLRYELIADLLLTGHTAFAEIYYKELIKSTTLRDLVTHYQEPSVAAQWIRLRAIPKCFPDPSLGLEEFDQLLLMRPEFTADDWRVNFVAAIKDLDERFFQFRNRHSLDCSQLTTFAATLGNGRSLNFIYDPWHVIAKDSAMAITLLSQPVTNEDLLLKYFRNIKACKDLALALLAAGEQHPQFRRWPVVVAKLIQERKFSRAMTAVLHSAGIADVDINNQLLMRDYSNAVFLHDAGVDLVAFIERRAAAAPTIYDKHRILNEGFTAVNRLLYVLQRQMLQKKLAQLQAMQDKYGRLLAAQGNRIGMAAYANHRVINSERLIELAGEIILAQNESSLNQAIQQTTNLSKKRL